jgi:glutaconate CoA-transferase subunit B
VTTKGPILVITDLCLMAPDPETCELVVTSLHSGVTRDEVRDNTGWDVRFVDDLATTDEPTADELRILRDLRARSAAAWAERK